MKRKSIVYFDFLNIIACLCVIGMHCNGIVHRFELSPAWWRSFLVEVLAYWAVPGFCMLSGATMMNYRQRYSTKEFVKRRVMKVGIPLMFWTAVFYMYKRWNGSLAWTGYRDFINLILNFKVENVYWFFAPLLMIYVSLPVLSKIGEDRKLLQYMIGMGVLTVSVLPFLCNLLGLSFNNSFTFPLTGGYILYSLIGYYLHTTEFKPWQRGVIYLGGIAGAVVRFAHTGYFLTTTGAVNKITWGYLNLPALALAVAVFVLAKQICDQKVFQSEKVSKALRYMAGASFGIYLIHVFVMNQMTSRLGIDRYSALQQFIMPLVIYVVCLIAVKLIQKVPFGKYIFP